MSTSVFADLSKISVTNIRNSTWKTLDYKIPAQYVLNNKSHYNYFNRFINLNLKNKVTLSEYSLLKKNIIA